MGFISNITIMFILNILISFYKVPELLLTLFSKKLTVKYNGIFINSRREDTILY